MAGGRKPLGRILRSLGVVNKKQVHEALAYQKEAGVKIGQALIELGYANEEQVAQALARQFSLPYVDLGKGEIPREVVDAVPRKVVEEHRIMPIKRNGKALIVAMTDPLDLFTLDNLRFILGTEVECALTTEESMTAAIGRYYGIGDEMEDMYEQMTQGDIDFGPRGEIEEDEDEEDEDAPVIRLVTLIIGEALKSRASDIHIEPMEKKLRVRYRVDGICYEVDSPPKRLQGSIISRVKIMSQMDIAEKRKPQDGRIKITLQGRDIDLRVSALPAYHGESVVMRILDKENSLVGLEEVGFHESDYARFRKIIKKPNGIFLVTGPTGSGKTTTLYAALKELNKPDVKIITAENPVEYNLSGINQCQVRHNIGLTFGRILRAMLRQAPNIILVGEIRDKETAEIAVQAALTGHLVFSTLHTNDAPGALTRLMDMGVKPFLVSSSVQAVMAQRLVRTICGNCREAYEPTAIELEAIGLKPEDIKGRTIYRGAGCGECAKTGYRGRLAIFELLEMSAEIRDLVFHSASSMKIRAEAKQTGGMLTLQADGCRKMLLGRTTPEEVLRMTHAAN